MRDQGIEEAARSEAGARADGEVRWKMLQLRRMWGW